MDNFRWSIPVEGGVYPFKSLRGAMQGAKELSSENPKETYYIRYVADNRCYVEYRAGHVTRDSWHTKKKKSFY